MTCNSLSQKKDDLEKIEVEKLKMNQDDVKILQDQLSALNLKIDDTKIFLDHGKKIEELIQANLGRTEDFGNGMKQISGNIVEMKTKFSELVLALEKLLKK